MSVRGLLYSFRRCPYAIRARLALAAAAIPLSVREVALKAKPPELHEASAKGTVPVLIRPEGDALDESLAILLWALKQRPDGRAAAADLETGAGAALVAECDGLFKHHLDGFRYGSTDRQDHRHAALAILRRWSHHLSGVPVLGPLDWALLPFVRQFRLGDPEAFAQDLGLEELKRRLAAFEGSAELALVMAPPWAMRHPWRSPRWLYHLALEEDWREARQRGEYRQSTRGKSLAEVGFIHASWSHQVEATWQRFYADGPQLQLLTIDPALLAEAAIPVRAEPAPGSGERFPHIFAALPTTAVIHVQRWQPLAESSMP